MKKIIAAITQFTGIVTPVAFVAEVIHDVGYFWIIGWKFQGLAGLADYLTGILEWLPMAAAAFGGYVLLNLVIINMAPDRWKQPAAPTPALDRPKSLGFLVVPTIIIFIFFGLPIYFLFDPSAVWLAGLSACILWLTVVGIVFWRTDLQQKFGQLGLSAFVLGPMIVVSIFFWGMQRAYFDLAPGGELYTLWRSGDGKDAANVSQNIKLLRLYQNGVLVRSEAEAKNQFFRWDQVKLLELKKPTYSNESLSCIQIGWFCEPAPVVGR